VEEIPLRMGLSWNEIRHLELHDSGFSDADLIRLPPMQNLEFLSLGSTNIRSLEYLDKSRYPKLFTLYLENTPITDRSLEEWKNPPVITKLFLSGTNITHLKWISKFPKLRHLNIERTNISSLEGLENCHDLINLWMGRTKVGDLTPLFHKKNLVYVSVDNLWIRRRHLKEFRRSNPYVKIVYFTHLNL